MSIERETLDFTRDALDDLPPMRIACPQCLDKEEADKALCSFCSGSGEVPAPWVAKLISLLEDNGFVTRTA